MRRNNILAKAERSIKSLALNVHFKHPDLGMKEYEILSRATAFLLSVDPRDPSSLSSSSESPYGHLAASKKQREDLKLRQDYVYEPAGGAPRDATELGWLEFCPGKFRPLAHVVAASHVLSPWMWKNYYPQPWLEHVTQDHVRYSVDVYDNSSGSSNSNQEERTGRDRKMDPLATFALNPYPIHHPDNMDLALVHLKSEEGALAHMKSLGVEMLYLTDNEKIFERGDEVIFDGFEVSEDHYEALENIHDQMELDKREKEKKADEDNRVFFPYTDSGNLIFASPQRFLASTETPLPEGVCGGPVLDNDGNVCGVVEGIVPKDHEDERLAGAASFIPYFRLNEFIDFAERQILERVVPKKLFEKVIDLKAGKGLHKDSKLNVSEGGGVQDSSSEVLHKKKMDDDMDTTFAAMVEEMKKARSPEQVEAILNTIEREQKEVMDILDREGGDVDEVIAQVRAKTRAKQSEIMEEFAEKMKMQEAEIVSSENSATPEEELSNSSSNSGSGSNNNSK